MLEHEKASEAFNNVTKRRTVLTISNDRAIKVEGRLHGVSLSSRVCSRNRIVTTCAMPQKSSVLLTVATDLLNDSTNAHVKKGKGQYEIEKRYQPFRHGT